MLSDLPETRAVLAAAGGRLVIVPATGSTNADLVAAATADPQAWPHLSVLATDEQHAGRGRLGRSWSAPAGTSLAASVLLRPGIAPEDYGWLPLAAGVAMAGAVRRAGAEAAVKWPNDVLVDGRKVCGILAEALPGGAVVVGSGVNLAVTAEQLPVPTATSLFLEGADPDPDPLLATYLEGLRGLVDALARDPAPRRAAIAAELDTIGLRVRVELPDGRALHGLATGLDDAGRLLVETDADTAAVAAGDVTHLRYE